MTGPRPRKLSVAEMLLTGAYDANDPMYLVRQFGRPDVSRTAGVDLTGPSPASIGAAPQRSMLERGAANRQRLMGVLGERGANAAIGATNLVAMLGGGQDVGNLLSAIREGDKGEAAKSAAMTALAVTPIGIPKRSGKALKALVSSLREEAALKGAAGATLNAATLKPAKVTGFMVGSTSKAIGPELTEEAVAKAVGKVGKNDHLGIWFDPESKVWYAEPSTLVPDREAALKLGAKRKQKAIGELADGAYKGDVPLVDSKQEAWDLATRVRAGMDEPGIEDFEGLIPKAAKPAKGAPFVSRLSPGAMQLMDVLTPTQRKLIEAGNPAIQSEHLNRYAAHMDPEAYEAAVRAGSPLAGWYKQLREASREVLPDPNENALLQLVGAGFSTQNPPSREMVSALKTAAAHRAGKTPGQAYRAGIGSKKSLLAQEMNVLRVLEAAREGKPLNPFEILSGPKVQNYAGSRLPPEVAREMGLDPDSFAAMDLHETRLEQLPQQYVSGRNEGGRAVQDARYLGPLAMRRTLADRLGMPTPDVQSSGWHFAQGSMDELGRRAHLKLYGKPQDAGLPLIKNPRGRKAIKTLGPEWAVQEMERIADSFGPENLRGMQTPSEYFGKPREALLPALAPGDPDALRRAARNVVLSAFDQYRLPAIAALTAGLPFAAAQREGR